MKPGGWDDPFTARRYRAFERRHGRYRRANEALAAQAALQPGLRVLDLAAGTGGTAAALLPALGPEGHIDCIEPAGAMAAAGRVRIGAEPRVAWHRSLAALGAARFDRIVCGAAIWQWPDLPALLRRLARRLEPGGALVFDMPAAYLGHADGPGGGADPYLTHLIARAVALHPAAAQRPAARALPGGTDIEHTLSAAGLHVQRWHHDQRLTQAAWCAWWCLPPLTAQLWPDTPAPERVRRMQEAARGLDAGSWRPERWLGWTAWKPAFPIRPLADASTQDDVPALRRRARRDGALLLRGVLPQRQLQALRRLVVEAGRAEGLLDRSGRWIGGRAAAAHEIPRWIALQQRLGMAPEFQALVESPRLLALMARVIGAPARGGLGSVCRLAPPDHLVGATPPHRDADFLRASTGVWSAWLPLEPCAVADGVLAVAPGSQRGAAARWAAADMAPGDVLFIDAHTLHRGCPNLRLREPRLSIDLRFGPATPPAAGGLRGP